MVFHSVGAPFDIKLTCRLRASPRKPTSCFVIVQAFCEGGSEVMSSAFFISEPVKIPPHVRNPEDSSVCSQPPSCGIKPKLYHKCNTSASCTLVASESRKAFPHRRNPSFRSDVRSECRSILFLDSESPSCDCLLQPQSWKVDVSNLPGSSS